MTSQETAPTAPTTYRVQQLGPPRDSGGRHRMRRGIPTTRIIVPNYRQVWSQPSTNVARRRSLPAIRNSIS